MSSDRILFIFNGAANRGNSKHLFKKLQNRLKEFSAYTELVETRHYNQIDKYINTAPEDGFDTVVVCGGDGTLNKAVSKLRNTNINIGLIPMGTGNDFSKSLGLSERFDDNLEIIKNGNTRSVDIFEFSGDAEGICVNTLGFGFDGWANYFTQRNKLFSGGFAYTMGALRTVFAYSGSEMTVKTDEKEFTSDLLMLTMCNGKIEGGNFPVAPEADISDGKMDVLMISQMNKPYLLLNLQRFKMGKGESLPEIQRLKCKELEFTSSVPAALHCDGEQVGTEISHLKVNVLKGAVTMIIP